MSDERRPRPDETPIAEADLARLATALRPQAPSGERAAHLRARVLASVAADAVPRAMSSGGAHRLLAAERRWRQLYEGVEICVLHEDEFSRAALLRMAPGSSLFPHRHDIDEESLILEGDARIGDGLEMTAGSYQFMPAGSTHPVIHSPGGCVVFVRGQRRYRPRLTVGLARRLLGQMLRRLGGGSGP